MSRLLTFEEEPFELESTEGYYPTEEAGGDFEFSGEMGEAGEEEMEDVQAITGAPGVTGRRPHPLVHRHRTAKDHLLRALKALHKHVVRRGGLYHLTLPAGGIAALASRLQVPAKMVQQLLHSLKHRNAQLRAARALKAEMELEDGTCAGETKIESSWWGNTIYLNECHTKALISAIGAGTAGAEGCAAIIPHPVVKAACEALALVGDITGPALTAVDEAGGNQGILFYRPWVGPVVPWHQ